MKISPLVCLVTFVFTLSAAAAESAGRDWPNMPELATSARDLASAFDAAGPASFHSEKFLQDGRRYILVLWKNPSCPSNNDVVCAYYHDGSSWVKLYQGHLPMWKGAPHIERRGHGLDLAEGAVLLLANDACAVSLGGVPRIRTAPSE